MGATVDIGDLFADSSIDGWHAILAVLILIASWILSRFVRRAVIRLLGRLGGISDAFRVLGGRVAGYTTLLVGVGLALSALGAQLQPVLAVAVLVGIVFALAMRRVASNFAAGIVIQTRKPIGLDDEIDALGHIGVVREFNGGSVVVETYDGRTVHLPNAELLESAIVNNSAVGTRRSEVEVRVTGDDLTKIVGIVTQAVGDADGTLPAPVPAVLVVAAEPERITMLVQYWHAPADREPVTSAVVTAISARLRQAGKGATVMAPPPAQPRTPAASI